MNTLEDDYALPSDVDEVLQQNDENSSDADSSTTSSTSSPPEIEDTLLGMFPFVKFDGFMDGQQQVDMSDKENDEISENSNFKSKLKVEIVEMREMPSPWWDIVAKIEPDEDGYWSLEDTLSELEQLPEQFTEQECQDYSQFVQYVSPVVDPFLNSTPLKAIPNRVYGQIHGEMRLVTKRTNSNVAEIGKFTKKSPNRPGPSSSKRLARERDKLRRTLKGKGIHRIIEPPARPIT